MIVLDLSFFIWDKSPTKECFEKALLVYEKEVTNHEAVMAAVQEACAARQVADFFTGKGVFIAKMKEIVLAHRLCKLTRAAVNVSLTFPPQRRATGLRQIRDEAEAQRGRDPTKKICVVSAICKQ